MLTSQRTGISSITGKTLLVRHATDSDKVLAAEFLKRHRKTYDLSGSENIVVARQEDRILGVGLLQKAGDSDCIIVLEDRGKHGLHNAIMSQLTQDAPSTAKYAVCRR